MDTRIIELAEIIIERAEGFMKTTYDLHPDMITEQTKDKHLAYKQCAYHALEILYRLEEYRQKYIEEYT